VVLSGEITMVVDDTTVRMKAGDCFVQRGTVHDWLNEGSVPCVVAMISMAALSVKIGDQILAPLG
jgi:mannose-6-phosphate isomerase-like protein (cupin superfamily)